MLKLMRKPGQAVWLGEATRVTIKSVSGNRVKLHIEAPDHCVVVRDEATAEGMNQDYRRQRARQGAAS